MGLHLNCYALITYAADNPKVKTISVRLVVVFLVPTLALKLLFHCLNDIGTVGDKI